MTIILSRFWILLRWFFIIGCFPSNSGSLWSNFCMYWINIILSRSWVRINFELIFVTKIDFLHTRTECDCLTLILAWFRYCFLWSFISLWLFMNCSTLYLWFCLWIIRFILTWCRIFVSFKFIFPSKVNAFHAWCKWLIMFIISIWTLLYLFSCSKSHWFCNSSTLGSAKSLHLWTCKVICSRSQIWIILCQSLLTYFKSLRSLNKTLVSNAICAWIWSDF